MTATNSLKVAAAFAIAALISKSFNILVGENSLSHTLTYLLLCMIAIFARYFRGKIGSFYLYILAPALGFLAAVFGRNFIGYSIALVSFVFTVYLAFFHSEDKGGLGRQDDKGGV